MSEENTTLDVDAIAVVGMAGRFPGAANTREFWQNLRNGTESISFFTEEELIAAGIDPALVRDPNYVPASGVLEDADLFDAAFFRYTPREAEVMDPQQRVLLECAWEALENAGCNTGTHDGPIGVFAGSSMNSYLLHTLNSPEMQSLGGLEFLTSADKDYLATRISYKLDLRGPSFTVQTACSTSLVAVCQACQSLADYQCDMALAGGVSVHVPQVSGSMHLEGGVTSPDGHTRAFDERGQGMLSGSGVGMVALKRLGDALADGDTIAAVIRGWAVNNDGAGKVGYTAPSVDGQANVIALAQMLAGVDPDTISYVEAHGTGTPLGDPIEMAALTQAFRASTERKGFCAVGSVKTNVGHLDAAAGVAGLIKTVLAMQHRELPASLHFEQPNPKIDFESSPFYVNSKLAVWKKGETPRRAGVSSFGIGGTNAHVVLEEAPEAAPPTPKDGPELLLFSARTMSALDDAVENLTQHLRERTDLPLSDVAYTLQVGRKRMRHRGAVVCADLRDAVEKMEAPQRPAMLSQSHELRDATVAFMFPGQGAQYVNMGRALYEGLPTFRREVDRCCERLESELGLDLRSVLYPDPSAGREEEAGARLLQTELTQPSLFVIEYALAVQWMDWGVQPDAMIGHSIGEYVAACLAGVLSLEDALVLVAARGRLMQEVPAGSMLGVPLPVAEVEPLLPADLDVALVNESGMCVVSGPTPAVDRFEAVLTERGVTSRRLQTSHAFHSAMLEPILDRFTDVVRTVKLDEPRIPYVSNVTGTWITKEQTKDPHYWASHMRQTILFGAGLDEVLADDDRLLLEVGPGTTLGTLAAQSLELQNDRAISSMRHPRDKSDDVVLLHRALGRLWLAGATIDWNQHHAGAGRQRIALPTYPFQRERYWLEPGAAPAAARGSQWQLSRRTDPADWFYLPSWKRRPSVPMAVATADAAEAAPGRWLVFMDALGAGERLVERLTGLGHTVFRVRPGSSFEALGEGEFSLAPDDAEQYVELVAALEAEGPLPDQVVHLWSMTSDDVVHPDELVAACFYSPVYLAQAIGPRGSAAVQVLLAGNGVYDVTGGERAAPEKAMGFGPVGAIAREYPLMTCRSLDLSEDASAENHADCILGELGSSSTDSVVAYRGGHRWVRCFEAIRLEERELPPNRLRDGGVYLVTGGLGGIGRTLALALAESHAAKLVLVNRSALPERDQWESWLASHADDDPTARRIAAVREMEAAGAEVLVEAADVADRGQMRSVIDRARERFGAIHGVIHAAGVPGGGVIQLKTREDADAVLAPKVEGARVLDELLADTPLDFLLLCSSLTAITGGAGQVDYTAANAFLDAFAQQKDDGVTISVNWDAWGEVGMAVDTAVPESFAEARAQELAQGLGNADGVEVLRRVLGHRFPQVLVSTRDLEPRVDPERQLPTTDEDEYATSTHARPELTTEYLAPTGEIEGAIATIWQEFFGLERVGVNDNFFELGGQSLLAIRVLSRVNAELDVDVSTESFFDSPTVSELALAVEHDRRAQEEGELEVARLLEMVEGLSEEEVQRMLAESEDEAGA